MASSAPLPPGRLRRRPRGGRRTHRRGPHLRAGPRPVPVDAGLPRAATPWSRQPRASWSKSGRGWWSSRSRSTARSTSSSTASTSRATSLTACRRLHRPPLPGKTPETLRVSLDYLRCTRSWHRPRTGTARGAVPQALVAGGGRQPPAPAEALRLRQEAATLLGQPTWAHHAIEVKMAETPEAVAAFYDSLGRGSKRSVTASWPCSPTSTPRDTGPLAAWDWAYTTSSRRSEFGVDANLVAEYHPWRHAWRACSRSPGTCSVSSTGPSRIRGRGIRPLRCTRSSTADRAS